MTTIEEIEQRIANLQKVKNALNARLNQVPYAQVDERRHLRQQIRNTDERIRKARSLCEGGCDARCGSSRHLVQGSGSPPQGSPAYWQIMTDAYGDAGWGRY
jgi:hypothetical protein